MVLLPFKIKDMQLAHFILNNDERDTRRVGRVYEPVIVEPMSACDPLVMSQETEDPILKRIRAAKVLYESYTSTYGDLKSQGITDEGVHQHFERRIESAFAMLQHQKGSIEVRPYPLVLG